MSYAAQLAIEDPVQFHRRALLDAFRCARCAEAVPGRLVLLGGECPHCKLAVHAGARADSEAVLTSLTTRWSRTRWVAHGLTLLTLVVGSPVPLLPVLLQVTVLVVTRMWLVRRPMRWMRPLRRLSTRLMLNMLTTAVVGFTLVLNLVAWGISLTGVLAVLSPAVAVVVTVLPTALTTEATLRLVTNRVRREACDPHLDTWEWALPLSVGVIGVAGFAGLVAVAGAATLALQALLALVV